MNAYLKQWQEIKRIRKQFAPIIKHQEAFRKSIIETQKTFKSLEPIIAEQERLKRLSQSIQIPKVTLPDISYITKSIFEYQKSIQNLICPAFEQLQKLQKSFRELPPRIQKALLLLGAHGWYLDLEMPFPGLWKLERALSGGNSEIPKSVNPAKWTYERLGKYIQDFEKNLDEEHEIGARLVSFGQAVTFHIEEVGYYGPDIITFYGINERGERMQLIQNISQLSVLLIAVKKLKDKPKRIGYLWSDKQKEGDNNA